MKRRNFYLTICVLSAICVLASSLNVTPDATMFNLFGYNVGLNFTHNPWIKLIGFTSLCLYLFNPTFKKARE